MFSVNQMIQGGNGALGSVGGTVPVVFKDAAGNIRGHQCAPAI